MQTVAPPRPRGPRPGRPPRLRQDLETIFLEVIGWSLMVGWGEQYLTPLALAFGVPEAYSGLVYTLPFLAGGMLQLGVPLLTRAIGSYRPVVVLLCGIQAATLLGLSGAAWCGGLPLPLLALLLWLYWGAGLGTGPGWLTWMDTLIPAPIRARFLAHRTLVARVTMGLSMLLSGWILETWSQAGLRLTGFAILMGVAGLSRLVSALLLARQSNVDISVEEAPWVSPSYLWSRRDPSSGGPFLSFLLVFLGSTAIALPLLPAWMLRQNQVGYLAFSWIAAAPLLARLLVLKAFGRVAAQRGPLPVVTFGASLSALVTLLWTLPGGVGFYLGVGALAGAAEAGYGLGSFLMFFTAIRRHERCSVMSLYNLAVGATLTLGALLGGWLLSTLGENLWGYRVVFGVSALCQFLSLGLLRQIWKTSPVHFPVEAPPKSS